MSQKNLGTLFIVLGIFQVLIRVIDLYPYRMDFNDWTGVLFGLLFIGLGIYYRKHTTK